ncbi:hypothetical protein TIFTF001_015641 [Ficus carica]|uniref:Uncharacterized protein n=1 Tax=Ficus carica TaxID=3494 RepID=A0AA88ASK1_FICCA|nr:hypothetical protein TIFTF001_015641 [Ficus carica]
MGCNESKQDTVATGNTILRRKQPGNVKSTKDIETVKENRTADNIDHERHARDVVGHENGVASTVIGERDLDDAKKESKGDNHHQEEVVNGGDDHDQERLICRDSPNHFFSSRKDVEETILGNNIDGIISEGRSGKSEYNTPRHKENPGNLEENAEKPPTTAAETEVPSPIKEEKSTTEGKQQMADSSPTEELKTV